MGSSTRTQGHTNCYTHVGMHNSTACEESTATTRVDVQWTGTGPARLLLRPARRPKTKPN